MAAAAANRVLDVPEAQVAIDFFDDEAFHWHHRLLLVRGAPGHWITCSPDHELEYMNLTSHRVVPLTRGGTIPERIRGNFYMFDEMDDDDLVRIRVEALQLARVVGIDTAAAAAGVPAVPDQWIVADTAHEKFGEPIRLDLAGDPSRFIMKDAIGMANIGDADDDWVAIENVALDDHISRTSAKQAGPGRDACLLPIKRTHRGVRRSSLSDALGQFQTVAQDDWLFREPRSLTEFLEGIEATRLDLPAYHGHWIKRSGVHPKVSVAVEFGNILEVLRHLICYDQLDVSNVTGAELIARRALQIQRAVRQNPRQPSFEGLEAMLSTALGESGGVVTSKFDEFKANEQKNTAATLKQQRLWREERDHEVKRTGASAYRQHGGSTVVIEKASPADGGDGAARGRGRGRGRSRKEAGGAQAA